MKMAALAKCDGILGGIEVIEKTDQEYIIHYKTGEQAKLNILNSHVFKYYMSTTGNFQDYPTPINPSDKARINCKKISDYDPNSFRNSEILELVEMYIVETDKIQINFDRSKGTMTVYDKRTNKEVFSEHCPISYANRKTTQTLIQNKNEYYFGGGMQNGRFTHKWQTIKIVNTNNWVDNGVTSPCPFYWSTYGFGVLRNTWQPGVYDFGSKHKHLVITCHEGVDLDAFYFINPQPVDIIRDYYELTGRPIMIPEYAFYEAHLNAFNRDYWLKVDKDTSGSILFEDGKYYKRYQPDQVGDRDGILESLNGEKNNYQFSARAMINRYKLHDMPFGWFVPNDGYGCGYGQTDSFNGDILNLKSFADYARQSGIEVALWTESNLEPAEPDNPKKGERDLGREVAEAGVVALKCDVAWIGSGYSFALNAVENATKTFMNNTKHNARPLIIMVDGWAGAQRYAGIWSGDQYGGQWEYIRFHIPTYIGSSLSGQPLVGSDMDGIFGGGNREVNIRDYQWKTFTPIQLSMDGWGNIPKTPFSFDVEATDINRAYMKLKSMLFPYNYTIAYESTLGLPMIRAMFLEFPEQKPAFTLDSQYQFMWGPSILVAPIYNEKHIDRESLRDGIYIPDQNQVWIDFFTGEKYQGGVILNNMKTPLWKLPVFIKDGAIIPCTNPNNNPNEIRREVRRFLIYPNGASHFTVYEDDGFSRDYLREKSSQTKITVVGPKTNKEGKLHITICKSTGDYEKLIKSRKTILQIMATKNIQKIKATVNDKPIEITKVETKAEFESQQNACFFQKDFIFNPYLDDYRKEILKQTCLLIKIETVDIISNEIIIKIHGFQNHSFVFGSNTTIIDAIQTPRNIKINEGEVETYIKMSWDLSPEAAYYEVERDSTIFTNIRENSFIFDSFEHESYHSFRVRAATDNGVSQWSEIVTVKIKEDPLKKVLKGAKVKCNIPCQQNQEICKILDEDPLSLWHTDWGQAGKANPRTGKFITLEFDLGDVYEIDKLEYTPREDAGNGTFLEVQYKYSVNGLDWSPLSDIIYWDPDPAVKKIKFEGAKMRYFELIALESVGKFGSGKHLRFFTK